MVRNARGVFSVRRLYGCTSDRTPCASVSPSHAACFLCAYGSTSVRCSRVQLCNVLLDPSQDRDQGSRAGCTTQHTSHAISDKSGFLCLVRTSEKANPGFFWIFGKLLLVGRAATVLCRNCSALGMSRQRTALPGSHRRTTVLL